jgi:lysophospholipase L1-like esterase
MKSCHIVWCGTSITAAVYLSAEQRYANIVSTALRASFDNIAVPSSFLINDPDNQGPTADTHINSSKAVNILAMEFGTNDGTGFSAAQFSAAQDTWIAARLAAGFSRVVPLSMLPCASYDSAAFRTSINAHSLSTYYPVADIGNTGTVMGAEAAKNDTNLFGDGVHPTLYGASLLAPEIQATFALLLQDDVVGTRVMRMKVA